MVSSPPWLQTFLDRLAADDLSAATRRGYRYDLLHFIAWYAGLHDAAPELTRLTEHDLITWRQHMMTQGGLKAASVNRQLEAVRRLLRWAEANGTVARNVALHVKSVRVVREPRPLGLTAAQVHGLLRAAGESSHGLARRNYALIQLMLQTGLRALAFAEIVWPDGWELPWQHGSDAKLRKLYGEPIYTNDKGALTGINEAYWAGMHAAENEMLYEPDEKAFYQYSAETGLYEVESADVVRNKISSRMLEVSREANVFDLQKRRSATTLNNVTSHLRGIVERRGAFAEKRRFIHLANRVIVFTGSDAELWLFAPEYRSRNRYAVRRGHAHQRRRSEPARGGDRRGLPPHAQREFQVQPQLVIEGDVDLKSGNIDTALSVMVKGDIKAGFTVKSGADIVVMGVVEDARISARGNISVRGGILPGRERVKAHGNLVARYITGREVKGRDIEVAGSVRFSRVLATGAVTAKEIIAGRLIAAGSLACEVLGSPEGSRTQVQVGIDPYEEALYMAAQQEQGRHAREVVRLKERCKLLAHKLGQQLPVAEGEDDPLSDDLRTALGDFAKACTHLAECEAVITRHEAQLGAGNRNAANAIVTVRRTAHPGVEVLIGELARTEVREALAAPVFRFQAGAVVWG